MRLGYYLNDTLIGIEAEDGAMPVRAATRSSTASRSRRACRCSPRFGAADMAKKLIPFVVLGGGIEKAVAADNEDVIDLDNDEMLYAGLGAKYRVENRLGPPCASTSAPTSGRRRKTTG